jgi:hypothetical protein
MKISAHLMEKGLNVCFDPKFKDRLPTKENRPFNLLLKKKRTSKELLNKKTMSQFILALSTMNRLSKINMQKKADKLFPSGRAWKL